MSDTKIITCTCDHKYQDEKYGKKQRVFNRRGNDKNKWVCTVCGKEHRSV